jgi:MarR family transcriptional regulator, 2-MHQ and catechol-resistance regulon repressor
MEIGEIIQSKFRDSQQKAVINVRYTSNFIGQYHNNYMSQFDLSMAQFNILRILRGAKGPLNVNAVKDRMIERSPNTTRLMDKLIEKGLLERVRCDADRRVVYVSITECGLELLAKIDVDMDDATVFARNLNDEEAEELSRLLDKLRGSCPLKPPTAE